MSEAHAGPPATDRIRVTGITAIGHHGVFDHERRNGQTFIADVVLHVDTRAAAHTDRLEETADYGVLAEQVAAVLSGEPADLIETVAERVAAVAMAHHGVLGVDVVLHKPEAPVTVPFADVTVEIHRDRLNPPVVAATPSPDGLRPEDQPVAPPPAPPRATLRGGAHAAPAEPAEVVPLLELDVPEADAHLEAEAPGPPPVAPGPVDLDDELAPTMPMLLPSPAPSPAATQALAPLPAPSLAPPGPVGAVPGLVPEEQDVEPVRDRLDAVPAVPVDVVLALGSNVGQSQETLRTAVAELGAMPGLEVTSVAPLARTGSVGGPDQADYLNTVVLARTRLSPRGLLHACQAIEIGHGREREVRWGPRTLDIDLITYGTLQAVADDLEVPHPRAHERAFVLEPWAQVSPGAQLPGLGGGPVAALAQTAPDRQGIRWMALDWWAPSGAVS